MTSERQTLLVDGHVHFHDCFDDVDFLDGARQNFIGAARELDLTSPTCGCLLFTESAPDHQFRRFRDELSAQAPAGWRLQRTDEAFALVASPDDGPDIVMLAGRQMVTAEGLEVLALGTDDEFPDGLAIEEAVARARASDAIAVLPWGFGKWWFGRGRLARQIVDSVPADTIFLGDNGGRPTLSMRPRLLARGQRRGIRTLPGSDPLPLSEQARVAGSFGFVLAGSIDWSKPGHSVKRLIVEHVGDFTPYGRGETIPGFCRQQVAMQIIKRRRSA